MGATGRKYLHPEPVPTRIHAPVSQRAASAVVWLLVVVITAAAWSLVILGGAYLVSIAADLFGGAR